MKYLTGNLITMALNGEFDVIVHGCNCHNRMKSGFAKELVERIPEAEAADNKTIHGDEDKLGNYSMAIKGNLFVVNAYTQYRYGTDQVQVDYGAMRDVFKLIKRDFSGKRIGFPLIGCGLAGGDWNKVSAIIDDVLVGENYTCVVKE